jgi:hypothetical protein
MKDAIQRVSAGLAGAVDDVAVAYFTSAEGAGEHCHVGSLPRAHQVIFD